MSGKSFIFSKKSIGFILLIIVISVSGFYLIYSGMEKECPITIPNATLDVTEKYAGYDFGITPTVKKYKNAVFDIEKIKEGIENNGYLEIKADGITQKIEVENTGTNIVRHPDFISYTGIGDRKFYEHISISDKALVLWVRLGDDDCYTDYFIDTTTTEDESGRLIHYCYSSKDVGWSDEHNNLAGNTLTPEYLGDNITESDREIYEFSEEDFYLFPVSGRFLKYGGGNLEISRKEAGNIRKIIGNKAMHYNSHYFTLDFIMA